MKKTIKISIHTFVWLAFAVSLYSLYISQDYNHFYPQTKQETARRMAEGK